MLVWKFASGYVKIRIMGKYPERLVNRAIAAGIRIRDAFPAADGSIECTVPMRNVIKLRYCGRGSGCRIRILSKHGLPGLRLRMRHDIMLCALAVFAIAALLIASTRVLAIDIRSGELPKEAVVRRLAETGVHVGMALRDAHPYEISNSLYAIEGVSKAEVTRSGVVLRVEVSSDTANGGRADPQPDIVSGIYASKDCVITSVSAVRGKAMVAPGDAVTAGQLLISGDYSDQKPGYVVPAEGEVFGRVLYSAAYTAEPTAFEPRRTGACRTVDSVSVLGREIFFGLPYEDRELELLASGEMDACVLPVGFRRYRCYELAPTLVTLGAEEVGFRAEASAQQKLFDAMPMDIRIISLHTERAVGDDGSVTATVVAVGIENIGYGRN